MSERMLQGEIMNDEAQVTRVGELPFGEGNIGEEFDGDEQRGVFEAGLKECVVPLTRTNTADCIDERITLAFADGTDDPSVIQERVVSQLQGGLFLATTKAAAAANIELIRYARNMREAYLIVAKRLIENGFEDAGHKGCGASQEVEKSVEQSLAPEMGASVAQLIVPNPRIQSIFTELHTNKMRRLEEGFYGGWDNAWHEDYLETNFPHNFAQLKAENDATHGHHGYGLAIVNKPGYGFKKNAFSGLTHMESFAATTEIVSNVANCLGEDPDEQWNIVFGVVDDLENVGNVLYAKGMPTYAVA